MTQALTTADYTGFEARRAEAAARGKLRGLGIANFIEQTGQADGEVVSLKFDAAGCHRRRRLDPARARPRDHV